ncbi:hypothetical protein FJZ53_01025, partial [Candidatus Woesearchaeota archaeon]|nr:hypothetical protein [Candidatus Woesearchaeota archaeon]
MPAAYAFDCDVLDGLNKIFCEEISLLGLSEEEKDMLIMDVLYSGRDTPDHGFVDYWNTNLEVVEPPEGVLTTDKGYIKGAWVKILAVMPSVLEADELYCSDSGELLTKYDYDVEIPSGKMGSDCRTDYELVSKSSKLSVYLNDNLIGNTEITAFTTSKDASFRAVLDVEQKTKIDRYAWRDYCCRSSQDCTYECTYKKGKRTCYKRCRTVCEQYCKSCDYYTTEYKEDKLTLTDSLQAKHYYKRPEIIFGISDEYYGIVEGSLNATGFANLRLEFEDAYYQNNKYHYDLFYSYKPYYVLTIRANEQLTESSSNVHVSNNDPEFRFIAERPQNC